MNKTTVAVLNGVAIENNKTVVIKLGDGEYFRDFVSIPTGLGASTSPTKDCCTRFGKDAENDLFMLGLVTDSLRENSINYELVQF